MNLLRTDLEESETETIYEDKASELNLDEYAIYSCDSDDFDLPPKELFDDFIL